VARDAKASSNREISVGTGGDLDALKKTAGEGGGQQKNQKMRRWVGGEAITFGECSLVKTKMEDVGVCQRKTY